MDPTTSGVLLMIVGAFLFGGAISFRQQKLPVLVQALMALVAIAFFGYGFYVVFAY
ncbi:hypothetical protein VVR12_08800 [Rothia sp. LK2588]|uniref:hypothetical protein n=1 Tax=Rothia sp. LK2588 TaxID=3114369 RepID=UPI0034CF3EB2